MPWRTDHGHDGPSLPEGVAAKAHAWLLQHLGEPWRMTEGWIVFGQEQGNRIDFVFNADRSVNLSARIDARRDFQGFATFVCELASVSHSILFSAEHWSAIEPTDAELCAAINRSRAAKYVNDPSSVLRGGHDGG